MTTPAQIWRETSDYYPLNLGLGLVKMGVGASTVIVATRFFGGGALILPAILSGVECFDLLTAPNVKPDKDSAFDDMGRSWTAELGIRSFYKGMQYATIGYLLTKIGGGLLIQRDFSALSLLKTGGYAVGLVVSLISPGFIFWFGFDPTDDLSLDKGVAQGDVSDMQKVLLALGLTFKPIPFKVR
ncbi:MAG: hypothetical protein AB7F31_01430 [Parachlamydiales bacterium]